MALLVRHWTCDLFVVGALAVGTIRSGLGQATYTCVPLSPSSIIWYWQKLGSKQACRAIHWPHIRGLAVLAGVWLMVIETEISATPRAHVACEGLYSTYSY